jgi:hypothetical protein
VSQVNQVLVTNDIAKITGELASQTEQLNAPALYLKRANKRDVCLVMNSENIPADFRPCVQRVENIDGDLHICISAIVPLHAEA